MGLKTYLRLNGSDVQPAPGVRRDTMHPPSSEALEGRQLFMLEVYVPCWSHSRLAHENIYEQSGLVAPEVVSLDLCHFHGSNCLHFVYGNHRTGRHAYKTRHSNNSGINHWSNDWSHFARFPRVLFKVFSECNENCCARFVVWDHFAVCSIT